MGLVRYRCWPGWISVELLPLDEPTAILSSINVERAMGIEPAPSV
jgi:hypothetical protein